MSGWLKSLPFLVVALLLTTVVAVHPGRAEEPGTPAPKSVLNVEVTRQPSPSTDGKPLGPTEAIRRALDARITLKCKEAPLDEVLAAVADRLGIGIVLDQRSLDDAGISSDVLVTIDVSDISLRSQLGFLLHMHDLTWGIRHEVLLVTTPEGYEEFLDTEVYDVADIVPSKDFDPLIAMIETCIAPCSWDSVGGAGSIGVLEAAGIDAIVVPQTYEVHEQIERLLADLRGPRPKQEKEKAILLALEKPVQLQFDETPLHDVIARLKKELGIEVNFDRMALNDAGIGDDMPMTASFPRVRARNALDFMLRQRDLAWIIQYEMLLITTLEAQENLGDVRVYNVADLVACRDERGALFTDFDSLIDVIENCIRPQSWDSVGGPGSIAPFEGGGTKVLVVAQAQPVHEEIQDLFAKLRGLRRQGALTPEALRQLAPLQHGLGLRRYGFSSTRPSFDFGGQTVPKRLAAIKPDPLRDAVVQGNNRFAFDLYGKLSRDRQGENLFFSPYSISTALAMTHAGARGETAEEMAQTLRFPFEHEKVHPAFRSLLKVTQDAGYRGCGCELIAANCLWGQEGYPFQQQFLKTMADDYSAGFATVDFRNLKAAAALINARVQEQTRQRIKNLIDPGLITPDIRLVLTSAVYFKGSWTNPFSESRTTPSLFHTRNREIRVAMMSEKTDPCRYAVVDGVQILDKPYAGGDLSMTILLPLLPWKGPDAFAALEQSLAAGKFSEWRSKLHARRVDVYLPKFKLETQIRLDETLKAMGMRLAFGHDSADFSGMNGGEEPLWIDFVVHKACVDVNEEGTEAAAATGMGGCFGGPGIHARIPEFRADRPFIFLIRDNRTGSILFLGRLMKPEPLAAL